MTVVDSPIDLLGPDRVIEHRPMARSDDGPLAFGSALDDVAVEQAQAAGIAELLDLAEQLLDRNRRVGGAPLVQVIAAGVDESGPIARCARRKASGCGCGRSA